MHVYMRVCLYKNKQAAVPKFLCMYKCGCVYVNVPKFLRCLSFSVCS
jgi:hypothetical protein